MSKQYGRGNLSTRKHGIGGHPSPNPRHVWEALRRLDGRKLRQQPMYSSVRELFARKARR